jgi:hypothetical protein
MPKQLTCVGSTGHVGFIFVLKTVPCVGWNVAHAKSAENSHVAQYLQYLQPF